MGLSKVTDVVTPFWTLTTSGPLPVGLKPFKSRESYVSCRTLQSYNSPGDWARELKPFADSASLVVELEKKIFRFHWGVFGGERHKWGCFWLSLPGPGPQPIWPLLWLKIVSETRPKSASLKPLNDFLAYL